MLRRNAHIFENLRMRTSSWTTQARPWQGQKFPWVQEFWQKTEVRPDIQVTVTNIRKWIVTVCHQKKGEGVDCDESVLWRAMCHSDRLAQSNYLRHDLTAVGAEANHIIATCTNQTPVSSKQTSLEEDPLNIEEPQEDPGNVQSDNKKDSNTRPLTALEKEEIKCLFQQEILDNVVIVLKDVRPKLSTSLALQKLLPYKWWSEESLTACGTFRQRSLGRNRNSRLKVANLVELLIRLHLQKRRWVPKNASGPKTTGHYCKVLCYTLKGHLHTWSKENV